MAKAILHPDYMDLQFNPRDDPERPWRVHGNHTYISDRLTLMVPDGMRTDLTSHPRRLGTYLLLSWPLLYFFPQFVWVLFAIATFALIIRDPLGKEQRASLFHDAGYSDLENKDKFLTDASYLVIMRHDRIVWWRMYILYFGVVLFGWMSWKKHRRNKK